MDQLSFRFTFPFFCMYRMRLSLFWVHFRPHCRSVDLSCISCAFVLRFRSSECTACVYHSFECTFGPTVARSISPASVALSFYVSVLLNVPHASIALLSALSAPLSLSRSFSSIRKSVFWELWFCVHCRSVGLSWISYIREGVFWIVRCFPMPIFPKQFSHKSGEGPRMWTVLSQYCQLFLATFGKDLFGSFPGSCGTFPGSCGSTRFGLAVFCFFSWMMWHFSWIIWHFSWIMWLYSIWPCSFLLLFLDDVALFLDHLALLDLALQFFASFPGWCGTFPGSFGST